MSLRRWKQAKENPDSRSSTQVEGRAEDRGRRPPVLAQPGDVLPGGAGLPGQLVSAFAVSDANQCGGASPGSADDPAVHEVEVLLVGDVRAAVVGKLPRRRPDDERLE